jgi:hypothetical protein
MKLGRRLIAEAERLDALATQPHDPPPPVADVAAMTATWVDATLTPDQLRAAAQMHRRLARQIHDRMTNETNRSSNP